MKVGIISQWFAPEQFPLPNSLAEQLVTFGDEVTVLTGFPSYPMGSVYEGYAQVDGFRESIFGATVHRVRTFLSHDSSALNRIKTFISFALSSVRRSNVLSGMDVNYVYATPMTAAAAAWWQRKRNGTAYVLHIQDLWPESVTSSGMLGNGLLSKVAHRTISTFLRPIYAGASHIVVSSPSMQQTLVTRGVDAGKITTVLNWEVASQNGKRGDTAAGSAFITRFVYAGNLGVMQDVETILRAAELLRNDARIEIQIFGSGVLERELRALASDLKLRNVSFRGRVSKESMSTVYAASDFQLVTLKDDPLFRMTVPSKFQAAMAHGIPIVSTVKGDLENICRDAQVGWTAQPEKPGSLAEAMQMAASLGPESRKAMKDRCRALYENELSLDKGIASVRGILKVVTVCSGRNLS